MKKKSLFLALLFICGLSFAALSFKTEPVKKSTALGRIKKAQTTYDFTLSQNSIAAGQSYRIQFSGSNYNGTFNFSSGIASGIPAGTYNVSIFPATSSTNHSFSGQSCASNYSGSGQYITWTNVLVCSGGFFSIQ